MMKKFSLTQAQQDIYVDQLRNKNIALYNVGGYIALNSIDVLKIQEAHLKLVNRYDAFGIRIVKNHHHVFQYISKIRNTNLPLIDFSKEQDIVYYTDNWLERVFLEAIDLDDCELFKAYLIKLGDHSYRYVGLAHHIIMDGWGFSNWARQLGNLYSGVNISDDSLTWHDIHKKDLEYRNSRRFNRDKIFWTTYLKDIMGTSILTRLDQRELVNVSQTSMRKIIPISSDNHSKMSILASSVGVSITQVYLALISVYIAKVYNQHEFIVGVATHNRNGFQQKQMIGVFSGVCPIRIGIPKKLKFGDICRNIKAQQDICLRHQKYPMGEIIKEISKGTQIRSIYQIGFNYIKLNSNVVLDGKDVELIYLSHNQEQTPIMFNLWDYGERRVEIQLDYNLGYFNPNHIESIAFDLINLIENLNIESDADLVDFLSPPNNEAELALFSSHISYWKGQLSNLPELHSLKIDNRRPDIKLDISECIFGSLSQNIVARLLNIANHFEMTPLMLLHGALAIVFARHSYSDDIVIGTAITDGLLGAHDSMNGFDSNLLVLRVDTGHEVLAEYLNHIRQIHLDAQTHSDVPFEFLLKQLNVPSSEAYAPLFQIMLTMNTNNFQKENVNAMTNFPSNDVATKLDINISVDFEKTGAHFKWNYDKHIFSEDHIMQFNEHLCRFLTRLSELETLIYSDTHLLVGDIPILSMNQIHHLTREMNYTNEVHPTGMLIHELFEKQVYLTPDSIALVFKQQQLTYLELNNRANQLAHYLREKGVVPNELICICVERSLEMVIGILAILKAGGAYVPIDPTDPIARLKFILEDTKVDYILSQSVLSDLFLEIENINVLILDSVEYAQSIAGYARENLVRLFGQIPSNLAYVIYTSGSTGQPKGVMVEHPGVVRLVINPNFMILDSSTCFLQNANIAFDAASIEIWGALLNGGRCILYDLPAIDLFRLNELIKINKVTSLWLTSGLFVEWSRIRDSLPSLKYLLTGGEVVSVSAFFRLQKYFPSISIVHCYGPTENTTFSACYKVPKLKLDIETIPIGTAVNGDKFFVLSKDKKLLPQGAIGELYISGVGLARGYLNQPELTADRFIAPPFNIENGLDNNNVRLYKTGDLVRYLPDGNLEFIGRVDNQVKIRGFRVELDEIAHQLTLLTGVHASVVVLDSDLSQNKRLVAYVVLESKSGFEQEEFVQHMKVTLKTRLPSYMVPSSFVFMNTLPLTSNGKINKKGLPAPKDILTNVNYLAPSTETEKTLIEILSTLLKLDDKKISVQSNFFELGGDSLLLIKLGFLINDKFGLHFDLSDLYGLKSLQLMAQLIDSNINLSKMNSSHKKTIILDL